MFDGSAGFRPDVGGAVIAPAVGRVERSLDGRPTNPAVAIAEPAESPATNKPALVADDVADAVARYVEDLQRAPLATRTREAYAGQVTVYGRWLTGRPQAAAALVEASARSRCA